MSATPSLIQVPQISGTPQASIDNVQLVTSAGTVQRQVVAVGDAAAEANYQSVDAQGNAQTRLGPSNTQLLTAALINFSGSGDNNVIVGVTNQIIRVYRLAYNLGGATNITYKSAATALSGAKPFLMGGAEYLDLSGEPWFVCAEGADFIMNSSQDVQVGGTIYYVQE